MKMPEDRCPEFDDDFDDSVFAGVNEEEINSLNMQLDQLNYALDKLEEKNNELYAELIQLLEKNNTEIDDIMDAASDDSSSASADDASDSSAETEEG